MLESNPRGGPLEHEVAHLHFLAATLVGADDAPDLVQDTWIAARGAGPKHSLGQWLRGVLRNKAKMRRRATARRLQRESGAASGSRPPPQPDAEYAHAEVWVAIRTELERLSEPERWIVEERFLEERSPMDIARELDVPVGTVRSRISRALAQLRKQLAGRHNLERGHLAVAILGTSPTHATASATTFAGAFVVQACVAASVAALAAGWWVGSATDRSPGDGPDAASGETVVARASTDRRRPRPHRTAAVRDDPAPPSDADTNDTSTRLQAAPAEVLVDVADALPDLIAQWDDDLFRSMFAQRDAQAMQRSFDWYRARLGACGVPEHIGGSANYATFAYPCESGVLEASFGIEDSDVKVSSMRSGVRDVPPPERVATAARDALALHNAWDPDLFDDRFSARFKAKRGGTIAASLEKTREALGQCELAGVDLATMNTALYVLDCETGRRTLSVGLNDNDEIIKFKVFALRRDIDA